MLKNKLMELKWILIIYLVIRNILVLQFLKILITKDILLRLNSSYGIAILKAFPLQLEVSHPNSSKQDSEWNTKMNFKQMEQDSNIAKKQLYNFYKKMGFKRYKQSEYFYLNPAFPNPQLDKININELS